MATLVKTSANCGTMADWFKSQGRSYSYTTTPKVGDIVFFDWDGKHKTRHHVGIVKKVYNGGESILTIEGNTAVGNDSNGGQVMERTRYRQHIVSYGRPAYANDAERDKFLARAQAEVGVKESPAGSNKVKYNTWYYGKAVSGSAYPWCAVFVSWVFNGPDAGGSTGAAANYGKELTIKVHQLQTGHEGPEVKTAQRIMYARGIKGADGKAITVDGEFGGNTKAATITLQKQLGVEPDGIWGVDTWTAALTALW